MKAGETAFENGLTDACLPQDMSHPWQIHVVQPERFCPTLAVGRDFEVLKNTDTHIVSCLVRQEPFKASLRVVGRPGWREYQILICST